MRFERHATCALVLASTSLLACGGAAPPVHASTHPSDARIDGAESTESFADIPPGTVNGEPQGVTAGTPPTYWVWRDAKAGWHLRTTSDKPYHFKGLLGGAFGPVAGATATRPELASHLVQSPGSVSFELDTQAAVDGVEFKAAQTCVHVELDLDDGPQAARLLIGGSAKPADAGHLLLCP